MARQIKIFSDASVLEYDKGAFDDWCVYLSRPTIQRYPPTDVQYFTRLKQLGQTHTAQKIYSDYIQIYDRTNASLDSAVLGSVTQLTSTYGTDSLEMDILLTIIYAGMVAEENKAYAILKKRIKRLGMHQILVENTSADYAAHFSRGKKWRDLDVLCKERGF